MWIFNSFIFFSIDENTNMRSLCLKLIFISDFRSRIQRRNRVLWTSSRRWWQFCPFYSQCQRHLSGRSHDHKSWNATQFRGSGSFSGLSQASMFRLWRKLQSDFIEDQYVGGKGGWRLLWNFCQWSQIWRAERGGCGTHA